MERRAPGVRVSIGDACAQCHHVPRDVHLLIVKPRVSSYGPARGVQGERAQEWDAAIEMSGLEIGAANERTRAHLGGEPLKGIDEVERRACDALPPSCQDITLLPGQ